MKPGEKDQADGLVVPVPSSPSMSTREKDGQHGMERQFSFFSIIGLAFAILNVSFSDFHFDWWSCELAVTDVTA